MRKNSATNQTWETISETYEEPSTTTGEVFDEIWMKDTSPVFLLTEGQEKGLMEKIWNTRYTSQVRNAQQKNCTWKKPSPLNL